MARKALTPACLTIVKACQQVFLEFATQKIRLAVSGGADSMSLLGSFAYLVERSQAASSNHPEIEVMVVDHQLQPGSAEVAKAVVSCAEKFGFQSRAVQVEVQRTKDGLEADARKARYLALTKSDEVFQPAALVLAHTLDDQAESVLLGLGRGSGVRSLAAMPMRWGEAPAIVRPLLAVGRETTRQACKDWQLNIWDDPMNDSAEFTRVKMRQTALPALAEIFPAVKQSLSRTAALARLDADYLDELAAAQLAKIQISGGESEPAQLGAKKLAALAPALQGRVVKQWLEQCAVADLSYDHISAVLTLVNHWHGQKYIAVPSGKVARERGKLIFSKC